MNRVKVELAQLDAYAEWARGRDLDDLAPALFPSVWVSLGSEALPTFRTSWNSNSTVVSSTPVGTVDLNDRTFTVVFNET